MLMLVSLILYMYVCMFARMYLGPEPRFDSSRVESRKGNAVHNVQFVMYDVTVSFMAQVLDTVTYLVPQVLDTAS